MSEALVPAAAEPMVVADGEADVVLPALIVDAGPDAVQRFLEFFAGRIANERTRAAYGRAVGQFLAWCEARRLGLDAVSPLHVAAYIRTHPGSCGCSHVAERVVERRFRPEPSKRLADQASTCSRDTPLGPPGEPRGRGAGAEARRHQGRDARS